MYEEVQFVSVVITLFSSAGAIQRLNKWLTLKKWLCCPCRLIGALAELLIWDRIQSFLQTIILSKPTCLSELTSGILSTTFSHPSPNTLA